MKKYIYLALVNDDFVLNEEVKVYFKNKRIEILKYYAKFNMLKLEVQNLLFVEDLKYINYLEVEKEFDIK